MIGPRWSTGKRWLGCRNAAIAWHSALLDFQWDHGTRLADGGAIITKIAAAKSAAMMSRGRAGHSSDADKTTPAAKLTMCVSLKCPFRWDCF